MNRYGRKSNPMVAVGVGLFVSFTGFLLLKDGSAQQAPNAPPVRPNPYARKAVDPALAEQGKNLFAVRCAFCHGSDARGGESGPNLLRSEIVLNDQDGEKIGPVILHGRPQQGMPSFDMSAEQINRSRISCTASRSAEMNADETATLLSLSVMLAPEKKTSIRSALPAIQSLAI